MEDAGNELPTTEISSSVLEEARDGSLDLPEVKIMQTVLPLLFSYSFFLKERHRFLCTGVMVGGLLWTARSRLHSSQPQRSHHWSLFGD